MKYEYKTIIATGYQLMESFQLGMWIIPDVSPPGVIPPTLAEIKQMYYEKIRLFLPTFEPAKRLSMLSPEAVADGWESIYPFEGQDFTESDFSINVNRQSGPMGWTTNYSPGTLQVRVRRPIQTSSTRPKKSPSKSLKDRKARKTPEATRNPKTRSSSKTTTKRKTKFARTQIARKAPKKVKK